MSALDDPRLATKLETWLAETLSSEGAGEVTQAAVSGLALPGVGQSNDTLLLNAAWRRAGRAESAELVLRRQPTERQLFLDADVLREAAVLRGLAATPIPVPRVRWTEADASILGAPFFLMERLRGRVPAAKPSIHAVGWLPSLSVAERHLLWESAMETFVAVHAVDWRRSHAFLLDGDPVRGTTAGYVTWLEEWYRWAIAGRSYPITDAALAYLKSEQPAEALEDQVLVWGDPRVGNILFGEDLRVVAALDWENARIGSPAADLAHWLFFDDFATTASGVERLEGFPDREATIARYEELSGRRLGDLHYFDVSEAFFIAVTLIRQADISVTQGRLLAGTTMGHGNIVTQRLARLLGIEEPELSPDYLAHRRPANDPTAGN
jgi:aminoglycoside phosphotransferase (APT) family kinase protein